MTVYTNLLLTNQSSQHSVLILSPTRTSIEVSGATLARHARFATLFAANTCVLKAVRKYRLPVILHCIRKRFLLFLLDIENRVVGR